MNIIRVALDLPLPQFFDYVAADATAADIGRRVRVPFGRFGSRDKIGIIVALVTASEMPQAKLKQAHEILRDMPPLPADWLALAGFCSRYYQHPLGEAVALALPPTLRHSTKLPVDPVDAAYRLTPLGQESGIQLRRNSIAAKLHHALFLAPCTRGALKLISPRALKVLTEMQQQHWVEEIAAPPPAASDIRAQPGHPLLAEQAQAIEAVSATFGSYATFLLHGITGSGKTEVYLQLIEQVLAAGKQALMLVPEIALTPQLEDRVRSRFTGASLVSLHSSMAEGARTRGFLRALSGRADIVLGTRLAVFTPLPRLGLIVVDEEHDASFKQQDGMRYSARDVAIYRAQQCSVPIVLGSATPSLESFYHACGGRYRLLQLTQRAAAAALPEVKRIDTRRLKLEDGMSAPLIAALAERIERGEQSLVFLNRRGYAPVLACPACGWVSRCRHCSANMVLHLADRHLRCHHCGAEETVPPHCPICGNQDIHPFGRGTQRLEAALRERFPDTRILRVDRDSARNHQQWRALLEKIHKGEADILVGTQMLAKGHDFPRLTLVGVLNADASLFAADFRAPERLFAQLLQVGGRSGRAALAGEVLIQTEYPDHPLYRALATHDYTGFAQSQLAERKQAGFPPFAFQALLRAEAPQLAQALVFLNNAKTLAADYCGKRVMIYDAVPMRLVRRANLERAQLLVESVQRPALQTFLQQWLTALREQKISKSLRWHIDVDPLEF